MFEKLTNYIKKQSKWFWLTILLTVIIDALNTAYFEKVQNYFYDMLEGKGLAAIYSLVGVYLAFIVLLIIVGMMSSYENKYYRPGKQKLFQKAAEFFTAIMIFGYGIIMILIGLFFVMLIMAFVDIKTRFVLGKRNYFYIYVIVLVLVSLFVDFSTAMWKFQLFDPEKVADPNRASRLIEFIAIFPLYAVFYSAPRFILLRKSYNIIPFLSALASTAYFVWESLAYLEL